MFGEKLREIPVTIFLFRFPGDYTCSVQNAHGSDQIIYEIIVQIPPMAPQLSVRNLTFTEVELFWTDSRSRKQPVLGYKLFYRYAYILALFDLAIFLRAL